MLTTTDGLVARVYHSGERDYVLHLITPTYGRLSVMVKGAHKKGSPLASIIQLFTWGNYELYKKGDAYWLRGGSVLNHFYELSSDLASMALAAYMCDVVSDMTGEGEGAEPLLRLLLNALYLLQKGEKSKDIIKATFELAALALSGYAPDLGGCGVCGADMPKQAYLDIMNGQIICADCQSSLNRQRVMSDEMRREVLGERRIICPMTSSTLAAMRYILSSPPKKIFSFDLVDREEQKTLVRLTETYLLNHLERDFETLSFYHSVE